MDVSTLAQTAVAQNASQLQQDVSMNLMKQAIQNQGEVATGLLQQAVDQAKAAAAEARGGIDIKV